MNSEVDVTYPIATARADARGTWFLAGAFAGIAAQIIALAASRTILAFGDEQYDLVGSIAASAALLVGSTAMMGGALAAPTRASRRSTQLQLLAFVVLASLVPAVLWRSGGVIVVGLMGLLAVSAVIALTRVLVARKPGDSPDAPSSLVQEAEGTRTRIFVPAILWGIWGALLALLAAVEFAVVAQVIADPARWAEQVSTDFDGPDGLILGRQLSTIAGVISAPLIIAMLAWVFYWAAATYSRPKELMTVPMNPFPARGPVRLALMVAWAVGLLTLRYLTVAAWQSTGGERLPQPVEMFFVIQQLFIAPILGAVIAVAVRGAKGQRPLALGIVVGAVVAAAVLAVTILL